MAKLSPYWIAVRSVHRSRSHFAKLLKGSGLTSIEKRLLKARKLVVDHQWPEALKLLNALSPTESLLLAERDYLVSESLNRLGRVPESFAPAKRSAVLYRQNGDAPGAFQGVLALAVSYHVQGHLEDSLALLTELDGMATTPLQRHMVARERSLCNFKQDGQNRSFQAGLRDLAAAAEDEDFPKRHRQVTEHVTGYCQMLAGQLPESLKTFELCLKRYPGLSRLNARFWAQLIHTLLGDRILPAPDAITKRSPVFFHRYECIRELQAGETLRAQAHWNQLRTFYPTLFGEPFEFLQEWGTRTAFGYLIDRYRPRAAVESIQANSESLEDLLIEILKHSKGPVPKRALIEKLYAKPYERELEQRFYKLVQRARNRCKDMEIVVRLGAYRIVGKA